MNKFIKEVMIKATYVLAHEYTCLTSSTQVHCLGRFGARVWVFKDGTYNMYLDVGKCDANKYKFVLNEYRELAENLALLDRWGLIKKLFDHLQTMANKHH